MSSFPIRIPYDLSSGLKQSYEPQNLPDLINDLRQNECGDEFKLSVLNSYLLKCQTELPVADVLVQGNSKCRSMTLKGIEILNKEITRIKKGIELKVSARLPVDFSAPNNPDIGLEQREGNLIHRHDKMQEAKLTANQTSRNFYNPPSRARRGPTHLNLRAKKRTAMMNFSLNPLTKPIWKNNRRTWTEELHARFLMVLHVLGGPEVATPKRIRDHMQVDGLTLNQVKSHLQKYRIVWRAKHPELAAMKPRKLKFHLGETVESSGAGSSMTRGNLV